MVMGKQKGNQFERLIYKDLRDMGLIVKRTIGSGSSDEPADILCVNYAIECKHLKVVNWKALTGFWNKLKRQLEVWNKTKAASMLPVIVYRQNRQPIMAMFLTSHQNKEFRCVTSYDLWKQVFLR